MKKEFTLMSMGKVTRKFKKPQLSIQRCWRTLRKGDAFKRNGDIHFWLKREAEYNSRVIQRKLKCSMTED